MWNADNPIFQVSGTGENQLIEILKLTTKSITGYVIQDNGFYLFWCAPDNLKSYVKFPSKLDTEVVAKIIISWLDNEAQYGVSPDHDGDNERGFLVSTGPWGHCLNRFESHLCIVPYWLMYGK